MVRGALWCFGGLAVTLFSYLAAVNSPYGGTYVIAWGAVVFGAVRFFKGRAAAEGRIDRSGQAHELLEQAARLEGADRAKAFALYAEIINKFPGTRASEEAKRNIKSLRSQGP